jgi:hypothetical protein
MDECAVGAGRRSAVFIAPESFQASGMPMIRSVTISRYGELVDNLSGSALTRLQNLKHLPR